MSSSRKMPEKNYFEPDVVTFVQEIQKFPCIYNNSIAEYSHRSENKRAWRKIAENFGSTEQEVKEKWRRIRIAFVRSLKMQYTHQTNKPYYLSEYLKFLLPYVKFNDVETDRGPSPVSLEYDHSDTRSPKVEMVESDDDEDILRPSERSSSISLIDTPTYESNKQTIFTNDITSSQDNTEYRIHLPEKRKTCDTNIENNPRKMFLLSIMPDVESFSDEEMRRFRRTVICLIDNIIEKKRVEK